MVQLPKVKDVFKEAVIGTEDHQNMRDLGIDVRKIGDTLNLTKFAKKHKIANLRVRNTLDYFAALEPETSVKDYHQ